MTRFEHLVTILKTFCAAPHLLNSGPSEMVPLVLSLLAEVTSSSSEIDRPPAGMSSTLPALCLLQAFSACDIRKLSLFGEVSIFSLIHKAIFFLLFFKYRNRTFVIFRWFDNLLALSVCVKRFLQHVST